MTRRKETIRLSAVALLLLGAGVGAAGAVDVRGEVRSDQASEADAIDAVRTPYWREWNGFLPPRENKVDVSREVTVALIGNASARDAVTVEFSGGALSPSTIVVEQGSTLRVRNLDDSAHRLYAEGLEKFDPVDTSAGQMREVRMLQTGSFPLRDALAPHVKGHLHVLAKVTAAQNPRSDGRFVFENINPGTYELKVFHGADEVRSESVEVKDKREFVIAPISLPKKRAK